VRQSSVNCSNWTSAENFDEGTVVHTDGITRSAVNDTGCDVARPVACCATQYLEQFAGFTTATFDGNIGGRADAHFACASEYAGSHLCHASEYLRTTEASTPPAGGAWLDASALIVPNGSYTPVTGAALSEAGRYGVRQSSVNCSNWTSAENFDEGVVAHVDGITRSAVNDTGCDVARPLACCM
jgi:hypothetical protein